MYMNCAVVNIVPRKSRSKTKKPPQLATRDVTRANAAAQAALAGYPDLFVANLKNINSCVTKETVDVVFDDPGRTVAFGDGITGSTSPSYQRGACVGSGLKSTNSAAFSSTSSSGGWSSSQSGNDWKWQGSEQQSQNQPSSSSSSSSQSPNTGQWQSDQQQSPRPGLPDPSDGMWHPELYENPQNGQEREKAQALAQANLVPVDLAEQGSKPDPEVEKELQAYLAKLYGKAGTKREEPEVEAGEDTSDVGDEGVGSQSDADVDVDDPSEEDDSADTDVAQEGEDDTEAQDKIDDDDDTYDEDSYNDDEVNYLYNTISSRHKRATRQQRWAAYQSSPSTKKSETSSTIKVPRKRAAGGEAPTADTSLVAFLARLNNLSDTFFTLIKYASSYLDHPPPPDPNSQGVKPDVDSYVATKPPAQADQPPESDHVPPTLDREPAVITRSEHQVDEHGNFKQLLEKLDNLQQEVSALFAATVEKTKSAGGLWSRVKRQMIISGIFPTTVQNAEPFYFGGVVSNGTPGEGPIDAKPNSGFPKLEAGNSTAIVDVYSLGNGTLGCIFNLSLVDRCLSRNDFIAGVIAEDETEPDTASLLSALEWCASADPECQGPDGASIRADGKAKLNDNCQSIFLTIGHCLLDDKDIKALWGSLDLSSLDTLANSPISESLYGCVQKNMFCAVDNSTTTTAVPTTTSEPTSVSSSTFNPMVRCDREDLKCQQEALDYVAKKLVESGYPVPKPKDGHEVQPFNPLVRCNRDDVACQAEAEIYVAKHVLMDKDKPYLQRRQASPSGKQKAPPKGTQAPQSSAQYDWSILYPHLLDYNAESTPSWVGPGGFSSSKDYEDFLKSGENNEHNEFNEEDGEYEEPAPVVKPKPKQGGKKPTPKTPEPAPSKPPVTPPTPASKPAPFIRPSSEVVPDGSSSLPNKPIGQPIDQAPKDTTDTWIDGVLPGLLNPRVKPPPTTTISDPDSYSDAAALFPFFMGPGPVVPPGVTLDWPGPSRPTSSPSNLDTLPPLTNDLDDSSEDAVRKFFSDLAAHASDPSNPSPTLNARQLSPGDILAQCPSARQDLKLRMAQLYVEIRMPCGFSPGVQLPGQRSPELEAALQATCQANRRRIADAINRVTEVLNGACEGIVAEAEAVGGADTLGKRHVGEVRR